jgi:hypothetical protein
MSKKIAYLSGVCAALFVLSAQAETVWKPPAEIADKPAAESPAAPAPAADAAKAAAPAAAPVSAADKAKSCNDQAVAKGLKGKAKRTFKATCEKS